jgi:hypothetical protein
MIAFLTGTAKKTSGTRILEAKERRQAEEEANIDEPVVKKPSLSRKKPSLSRKKTSLSRKKTSLSRKLPHLNQKRPCS